MPAVSPAYESSQAESAPVRSEDLPSLWAPSLVLEPELNKICLEVPLGFALNFYLGEPKNPNASNSPGPGAASSQAEPRACLPAGPLAPLVFSQLPHPRRGCG